MNTSNVDVNRSLKASYKEGTFAAAMTGFTQEYFTPFLLLIGGTVRHVGFLIALPNLIASLIQLKSADIVDHIKSRKRTVTTFVFFQALMLVPMVFVALRKMTSPAMFIALVILFTCCAAVANPAWGSIMSDLIKKDKRGFYFGRRTKMLGFVTVGAMVIAGSLLYLMKKIDIYAGFALLFAFACIWRMVSWYFLRQIQEPFQHNYGNNRFTVCQFLKRLKESNFAKFVLFVALMNFSVNVASPFFAVLMLKDLKFNYLLYTIVTLTATFTIYCTITRWGIHADKVGNLKVLKITAPFIGIIPILWIVNRNPLYLIGAQVVSGFLWAGFNLCTSNFIYDAVSPEKRTRCIAYFNALNGIALCLGAVIGGFSLTFLPPIFGHKILTLFAVSAILRIAVGITLPGKLKEVRHIEKMKSIQLFFSMLSIRPVLGIERKTIRY